MAKKFDPTPEQSEVIRTTDRTVLLSAAAGSGKTATLTRRLIEMITNETDPLDVTRMLVVTFTRAAAEELRTRISAALAERVLQDPENERLSKQLLLLPTARIRTIDAFCNDLVKGHTELLGISPLYRIADESEVDVLGFSLLDDLIEDAYDGVFAPEGLDIASVVEVSESVKSQGTLADVLYKLYKTELHGHEKGVAVLKDLAEALEREAALPLFETRAGMALREHYLAFFSHLQALLRGTADDLLLKRGKENIILKTIYERFTYLYDFCNQLSDSCKESFAALREKAASYALPDVPRCPSKYVYSPEEALYKKRITDTNTELKAFFKEIAWEDADITDAFRTTARITRSVYLLLSALDERLFAEKKRRAIFDYDDITAFASRLLSTPENEPTPLALEFRSAFDAICIDEYQDVNATQHRIFECISTKRNRFMVGDIKQSIYAFRGAVPSIFRDLRDALPQESADDAACTLYLTENFRSEKPVITFANGVFDFLFSIIKDSIGYRFEDRLATTKEKDEKHVLPTLLLLEKEKKEKAEDGAETPEASEEDEEENENVSKDEDERIAQTVLLLLKEGRLHDGSPVRPSDIAILSREYPYALVETLRAKGIPLRTKDKTDFFSRKEILLALSLCHAINNPHRDIYLGALLRSPLYGFTLDEMIAFRGVRKDGSLYTALCTYAEEHPENERAARVLCDLSRFSRMAENMPSHRLIRAVFDELGIYTVTDGAGRGALRAFYELARSYEATAFRGLYRFLDRITEIRKYSDGLSAEEVGEKEAVTVSTIHASKGLEYPICILAHTGKSLKKANKSPFGFSNEQGLVFSVPDKTGRALLKTPLLAAYTAQKTKQEVEEAVRVLYVALTRPKEQLYIFCSHAKKLTETLEREATLLRLAPSPTALSTYSSYGVWLLSALPDIPDAHNLVRIAETDEAVLPALGEKAAPSAVPERTSPSLSEESSAQLHKTYKDRFAFRYPHEAETRLPAKLPVSSLRAGMLDEKAEALVKAAEEDFIPTRPLCLLEDGEKEAARTGEKAAKAGSATHLFLQFCDFKKILTTEGCQKEVIDKEISRLEKLKFMTKAEADLVRRDELCTFLSSDLAREIKEAKSIRREFRFHASLPAEDFTEERKEDFRGVSLFLQGIADLIVTRRDGTLLLVDYKTDRIPHSLSNEDAAALLFTRHGTQLAVYAGALAEIFGETPEVAIYSLPRAKLFKAP